MGCQVEGSEMGDAGASKDDALRLIEQGNVLEDAGRHPEALRCYETAIKIAPTLARAHLNRGNVLLAMQNVTGALEAYAVAIANDPNYAAAHYNMGNALLRSDRPSAAQVSYRNALALKPDFADAEVALGSALTDLGQFEEAIESCHRALALNSNFVGAHISLGNAYRQLGQFESAAASYRNALQIKPDDVGVRVQLGNALIALSQFTEAETTYRIALKIDSDSALLHYNLGIALQRLGRVDEAVSSYRRALVINPDHAEALGNLGNALRDLGQIEEGKNAYFRALEIQPDLVEAHFNLGVISLQAGLLDDAAARFRTALASNPNFPEAYTNLLFCLSHDATITAAEFSAAHREYGERFETPLRASWPSHPNARNLDRCLRVGFVSGDFRNHAVAHFVGPVLAELAREPSLSLIAYYNNVIEDGTTQRLRGAFKQWSSVAALSDADLARKIADDGIDVLIDLSGHTAKHRLMTFARKPAPVQVSWIGSPATTGLRSIDYYLADRHFLPIDEFSSQFTEKLVHLPATAPFRPEERAPAVNALPALANGYITFGSFNRLNKLRPPVIALWSRLLRAVPESRMLLGAMPPEGQHNPLIEWFAREGIARERLSLHGRCEVGAYLALHHQVDLCLDTFPFTGLTVSNHALWMGVPTLTLIGPTSPSRQGARMLVPLGLERLVASDPDDFVTKGVAWTANLREATLIRTELRERFLNSVPGQPKVIADGFQRALRIMWQSWCAGMPPASFNVDR